MLNLTHIEPYIDVEEPSQGRLSNCMYWSKRHMKVGCCCCCCCYSSGPSGRAMARRHTEAMVAGHQGRHQVGVPQLRDADLE